ncbi:MAG: hypothetical protein SPL29_06620 [Bacteroidales bacterium]|nr:hypothetical protein [Bacteroidales bacterium]
MDIIGLESFFAKNAGKDGKISFGEFAKKVCEDMGVDLDTFTKAAILSALSVGKMDLYNKLKKAYIQDVVIASQNEKLKQFNTPKDLERIKLMEEFELELQQVKLDCVKKKMGV